MNNLSGGVFAGDELTLQIALDKDARAQITSIGAMRLYRARAGAPPSVSRTQIKVATGALLEFIPDPLIPFAQSRSSLHNAVDLEEGAALFWWDLIWPGREAAGEVFQFHELSMATAIRCGGLPVALERINLRPLERPLDSPARMGHFRYLATFYVCRPGESRRRWQEWEAQLMHLAEQINSRSDAVTWGVSRLPEHGLVVRGLGRTNASIGEGVAEFWRTSRLLLTGEEATLPRKTY